MTTNNIANRLPAPIENINLPKLTGSEKQVRWAEKIRIEILTDIMNRLDANQWLPILSSTEKMIDWVETYPIKGTAATPQEYGLELLLRQSGMFAKMIDLAVKNTDARFWIDNRTDQMENYMNKAIRKQILG